MRIAWLVVVACSQSASRPSGPPKVTGPDPLEPSTGKECADDRDCTNGERCFAPDFKPGRGTPPQCDEDRDCRGRICDDGVCRARCQDEKCAANENCLDSGHCAPYACNDASHPPTYGCPQNHSCNAAGTCERKTCKQASDCDTGVCWQGRCFAHGGSCHPQSYCCPP
jgi:hypothetical protein